MLTKYFSPLLANEILLLEWLRYVHGQKGSTCGGLSCLRLMIPAAKTVNYYYMRVFLILADGWSIFVGRHTRRLKKFEVVDSHFQDLSFWRW